MSRPRKEPRLPGPPPISRYRQKQLQQAADTLMGQKLLAALLERKAA